MWCGTLQQIKNKAEILKITTSKSVESYYMRSNTDEVVLFENKQITNDTIEFTYVQWSYRKEDKYEGPEKLKLEVTFRFGDKVFVRKATSTGANYEIKLAKKHRDITRVYPIEAEDRIKNAYFNMSREDFEKPLFDFIVKFERNFCLTEQELLTAAFDFIKQGHNFAQLQTHREIAGCIIDGMAFFGAEESVKAKIIGFEVKTNKDNYLRLYNQLNAYLDICDEVYLIIEDKDAPKDLPFYVGIIKVNEGIACVERKAQGLKHDVDESEFWGCTANKVKYKVDGKWRGMRDFFKAVSDMKRKLIFYQFYKGYNATKEAGSIINEDEKRLIEAYFKQNESKEDEKHES